MSEEIKEETQLVNKATTEGAFVVGGVGGVIAPVVGNLADTYSLPIAMMTLVPFLIGGLGASLLLKDPKKLQ